MTEAVARIEAELFRLGLHGLQRLSSSSVTELRALAQTAHNAGLILLERRLDLLATLAERYLDRDPLFTSPGWTGALNGTWLRARATAARLSTATSLAALRPLVGEARRTYHAVPHPMRVEALTARGWVSDTGFVGVTVTFGEPGGQGGLVTASNARPTLHFGNDPRELLNVWASDTLPISVGDLAHGAFELHNARRSDDGRLSLHRELVTRNAPSRGLEPWEPSAVPAFAELLDLLRAADVDPLTAHVPPLATLRPHAWGPLTFDRLGAYASATLTDDTGAAVTLAAPLRPENNHLLDVLDAMLGPQRTFPLPDALVVEVRIARRRLEVFPLTALYARPVELEGRARQPVHSVHLTLEAVRGTLRRQR